MAAAGFLVAVVAFVLRFGFGFGFRPLLYAVMLLVLAGVVLIGVGFLGETVAGTRDEIRALDAGEDGAVWMLRKIDDTRLGLFRRGPGGRQPERRKPKLAKGLRPLTLNEEFVRGSSQSSIWVSQTNRNLRCKGRWAFIAAEASCQSCLTAVSLSHQQRVQGSFWC